MHYKTTDPTKADSSCCTIFLTGEAIQDSKPFSSACFIAQNVLAAGTFVPPPLEETYSSTETIQALAGMAYLKYDTDGTNCMPRSILESYPPKSEKSWRENPELQYHCKLRHITFSILLLSTSTTFKEIYSVFKKTTM